MSNPSSSSSGSIGFNPNAVTGAFRNLPAFKQFVAPPPAAPAPAPTASASSSTAASTQSQPAASSQPQSQPTSSPANHVEPSKPVSTTSASSSSNTASAPATVKTQTTAQSPPKVPGKFYPPPTQTFDLDKCKSHRFVTLDGLQYQTRQTYDDIAGTFQWEACTDQVDRCVEYIRDQCADRRVFLVASGGLGAQVVPKIHHLPQLYAVYIHCADVDGHRKWAKDYYKVRVVCFDDVHDLLPQFAVDMAQSLIEWGDAWMAKGDKEKAKTKYQTAFGKLNHCRLHDPDMDGIIQKKLAQCT